MDDEVWDELLEALFDKKIIPILGAGLLKDQPGELLHDKIASILIKQHDINVDNSLFEPKLENVSIAIINKYNKPDKLRSMIFYAYESLNVEIPSSLKKLVQIDPLRLFLTTTFDNLLTKALKNHRGPKRVANVVFSGSKDLEDIDSYEDIIEQNQSININIFGKVSLYSEYVITDENLLEEIIKLYTLKEERLPNFFDALRNNELLFIGCNFPDWLGKFFIRAITYTRFNDPKQPQKYLSDNVDLQNKNYTYFLKNYRGYIFNLSPEEFVDTLYKKWKLRAKLNDIFFKNFVFISFAHADREKAKVIRDRLETICPGNVWFDEDKLQTGSKYDTIIKENIKDCALFIPLLSNHTIANYSETPEPYYKKEWGWAKKGRYDMLANESDDTAVNSFICPIIIDDGIQLSQIKWLNESFGNVTIKPCVKEDQIENFVQWVRTMLLDN